SLFCYYSADPLNSPSFPTRRSSDLMRELAAGNFEVQLPGLDRRDEVGQMAHGVQEFKVQAVAKAERETAEREEKNREQQAARRRSEEHTSELQSHLNLVCRLLLEKK